MIVQRLTQGALQMRHCVSARCPHTIGCWRPYIHWVSLGPHFATKICGSPFTPLKPLPPSPFQPRRTPNNCLPPSLLRKTQWLTFNNASSYSSSYVASHCAYLLLIVCGAYGLVTLQAEGHQVKEFKPLWESFWVSSSWNDLVIRHSYLNVQTHIHMPAHAPTAWNRTLPHMIRYTPVNLISSLLRLTQCNYALALYNPLHAVVQSN